MAQTCLPAKNQILERWAKHFHRVLNKPSKISYDVIAYITQVPINHGCDAVPIAIVLKASIDSFCSKKYARLNAIPSKIYKLKSPAYQPFPVHQDQETISPEFQKRFHNTHLCKLEGSR